MGSNTGVGEPHSPDGESGRHAAVQVAAAANALRWRQEFPGEERQLGVVRRWLASLLPECPARDDVISVATELGSNALRHTASGRGGLFAVEITWHESIVRVSVADGGGPTRPRVIEDLAAEQGRGLLLVSGLSVRSGVTGDHRGRLVWADITWDGPDAPTHALAQDSYETAIRDGQTALTRRFADVPVWFGRSTLAWWALAGPNDLVTAPTAGELADLLYRLLDTPILPQLSAVRAGQPTGRDGRGATRGKADGNPGPSPRNPSWPGLALAPAV
jgi:serine/threonine-protein kinase RsbW